MSRSHAANLQRARRPARPARGFTLIEVCVSAIVLGVAAIAYAGFYKAQDAQRGAQEQLVVAMELATRQIEFLRTANETLTAGAGAPPFTSNFPLRTVPISYANGGGGSLERAFPTQPVNEGVFLVAGNSFAFSSNPNGAWLTGLAPGKPGAKASTPIELALPDELAAKGYTVEVRAARVRNAPATPAPQPNLESLLVKYQVEVSRGGVPVLVVPYLKQVRF